MRTSCLRRAICAVVVCGCLASSAAAEVTFGWEYGETEARCDNNGDLLEVQNAEFPDGALSWSIGWGADIEGLQAEAVPTLSAQITPTVGGGYSVVIDISAEVYANLIDPSSDQANAMVDIYFQLAMFFPAGEYYAYTLVPDGDIGDIAEETGDCTLSLAFVVLNDSNEDELVHVLSPRDEGYSLYGGIILEANDALRDGLESHCLLTETITLELTPVPEPASLSLLALGGILLLRRRRG
ncbi:MAG: PEP-CTERM sorting domain-containing protein [Planctomycetes bacterium]|nr:PEP-CTERM sorting domain-containing protein [Planctomycetota bacterium]